MPVCARTVQQPDGSLVLALDPAVSDLTTCAYLVETGSPASAWAELGSLTIPQAEQIGMAVVLVWAVAWTFRVIGKSISSFESSQNE